MKTITLRSFLCLALASMLAVPAAAQTPMDKDVTTAGTTGRAVFSQPAAAATLDAYRGGQLVQNNRRLSGTTAGNTAEQVITGNNAISSGSFSNMSGLATSIQNTGNNVLIQNAVILNLQMN